MAQDTFVFYLATEPGQAPQIARRFGKEKFIFNKRRSTLVPAAFAELLLEEDGYAEGAEVTGPMDTPEEETAAAAAGEAFFKKLNPQRAAAEAKARKRDEEKAKSLAAAEAKAAKEADAAKKAEADKPAGESTNG